MMRNSSIRIILIAISLSFATGCLATRAELRNAEIKRTQVSAVQERQAQAVARLDDYDQQFRVYNGRLDVVENQLSQINAGHVDREKLEQKNRDEIKLRFKAYEEALAKLESQVQALTAEVKNLQKPAPRKQSTAGGASGSLTAADAAYELQDWKLAIVEYENYRKENPKGKSYPAATLKIGMAFHELGKKDEAKVFLEEVIAKFPKSKEAKKASQRLKTMK